MRGREGDFLGICPKANWCWCPRVALNVQHAPHKYFKCPFGSGSGFGFGSGSHDPGQGCSTLNHDAALCHCGIGAQWQTRAIYGSWLNVALECNACHANFQLLDCLMHSEDWGLCSRSQRMRCSCGSCCIMCLMLHMYVPQHFYFSVSQLQFAALISFSSSYMHRASCHSQHVASSLINDVNDAFAAIACPDYFHRRATRSQTQLSTLNWNLIGHATSKPCKSHF